MEAAQIEKNPVGINLEQINLSLDIKQKIVDNFHELVDLLQFKETGYDTFKKWYVDGRLYYHIIIDPNQPKKGILELRPIDSMKIKKVRQVHPTKIFEPKIQIQRLKNIFFLMKVEYLVIKVVIS